MANIQTDRSNNIYLISDTHFGHRNIIDYCNRPFKDTMQMNLAMAEKWNSTVKDDDIVYHLGDVYMGWNEPWTPLEFLSKLKGRKRLVLGNHDNGKDQVLQKVFQKIMVWRMFPEFGLLLTHVPVHESALERRIEGHGKPDTIVHLKNVHGHIHEKPSPTVKHHNVSVEQIAYTPINIEELRIWDKNPVEKAYLNKAVKIYIEG